MRQSPGIYINVKYIDYEMYIRYSKILYINLLVCFFHILVYMQSNLNQKLSLYKCVLGYYDKSIP